MKNCTKKFIKNCLEIIIDIVLYKVLFRNISKFKVINLIIIINYPFLLKNTRKSFKYNFSVICIC